MPHHFLWLYFLILLIYITKIITYIPYDFHIKIRIKAVLNNINNVLGAGTAEAKPVVENEDAIDFELIDELISGQFLKIYG